MVNNAIHVKINYSLVWTTTNTQDFHMLYQVHDNIQKLIVNAYFRTTLGFFSHTVAVIYPT